MMTTTVMCCIATGSQADITIAVWTAGGTIWFWGMRYNIGMLALGDEEVESGHVRLGR